MREPATERVCSGHDPQILHLCLFRLIQIIAFLNVIKNKIEKGPFFHTFLQTRRHVKHPVPGKALVLSSVSNSVNGEYVLALQSVTLETSQVMEETREMCVLSVEYGIRGTFVFCASEVKRGIVLKKGSPLLIKSKHGHHGSSKVNMVTVVYEQ